MGDMADDFKLMRDLRNATRWKFGIACATCVAERPFGDPTIMLPGQRCRVCGGVDQRPELTGADRQAGYDEYMAAHPHLRPKEPAPAPRPPKRAWWNCGNCPRRFQSKKAIADHKRSTGH